MPDLYVSQRNEEILEFVTKPLNVSFSHNLEHFTEQIVECMNTTTRNNCPVNKILIIGNLLNTFIRHLGSEWRQEYNKEDNNEKRTKKISDYRVSKINIAVRNSGIFR